MSGQKMGSIKLIGCLWHSIGSHSHLNHLLDTLHHRSLLQASIVVGFQLGYTVIFGWYASFLFVRTGLITVASIAGLLGFVWLLFPFTYPYLYNYEIDSCECWHRYCTWQ
uniref:Uncharacterized protein n=1 Tax=Daucus carota subsp. sativus TaxID=79200 RepID=A0A162AFM7_DAUCS